MRSSSRQVAGRVREADRPAARDRRTTARSGAGTGSTSSATPRPTATSATARSRSPGATATTSSGASTTTSRTTQFVREQLAGDEMPGDNPDAIIATGYYRLGLWDDEPADPLQARLRRLRRHRRHDRAGVPRHDGQLRPLPRPQDRPDPADRLLPAARVLPRHPAVLATTRDVRSAFNLTDITPPEQRAKYEEELKKREARIAEIKKAMDGDRGRGDQEDAGRGSARRGGRRTGRRSSRKIVPMLDGQAEGRVRRAQEGARRNWRRSRTRRAATGAVGEQLRREPAARRTCSCAAAPHATGEEVEPGFPEVLGLPDPKIPDAEARREDERPAHGAGGLDRVEGQPADGPRDGQPRLAVPLRPRASCPARTTSASSASSRRTRNCSTGWRASSSTAAGS